MPLRKAYEWEALPGNVNARLSVVDSRHGNNSESRNAVEECNLFEIFYRPYPKDGEGTVFTGKRGWGYHSPRFFPKSLVPAPFQGVPQDGYPPPPG